LNGGDFFGKKHQNKSWNEGLEKRVDIGIKKRKFYLKGKMAALIRTN